VRGSLRRAERAHVERWPAKPLWRPKQPHKRSALQLAQTAFVREAVPRLMREQGVSQSAALTAAMTTEWPTHKAQLELPPPPPPPPPPPRPAKRPIVVAEPLDDATGAVVSEHVRVLGLHATSLTALPPPAFMPLNQMPKKKRVATGPKLKPRQPPGRTPATRAGGRRQRRRPASSSKATGPGHAQPPQQPMGQQPGPSSSGAAGSPSSSGAAAAAMLLALSAGAAAAGGSARAQGKRKASAVDDDSERPANKRQVARANEVGERDFRSLCELQEACELEPLRTGHGGQNNCLYYGAALATGRLRASEQGAPGVAAAMQSTWRVGIHDVLMARLVQARTLPSPGLPCFPPPPMGRSPSPQDAHPRLAGCAARRVCMELGLAAGGRAAHLR
jgi:hypothetical protein